MRQETTEALWALMHTERAALADDLAHLTPAQWRQPSLCELWSVEEALAHLTAAASVTRGRWIRSMAGARFRPAVHNQRRLAEQLGASPAETLERFRAVMGHRIAPTADLPAYLGEVIVHAQDIRHPLGLPRTPGPGAATVVAEFFVRRNFTVASRSVAAGLRLEAVDSSFASGQGPLVSGSAMALVMVLAGRPAYLEHLDGPGLPLLAARVGGVS